MALWEISARLNWVNSAFTSLPSAVILRAAQELPSSRFWDNLLYSGSIFLTGYSLACLVGIVLGILVGWFAVLRAIAAPFIAALYSTPRIAFLPLLVIAFGIGAEPKVIIVFISAVIPIIMNTQTGIGWLGADLLRLSRSFRASSLQVFWTIALPGSVPYILSGMRVATGHALIGVLVGEMYGSFKGLGHAIYNAGHRFDTEMVMFGAFLFAVMGVALNSALDKLETRFDAWRPTR